MDPYHDLSFCDRNLSDEYSIPFALNVVSHDPGNFQQHDIGSDVSAIVEYVHSVTCLTCVFAIVKMIGQLRPLIFLALILLTVLLKMIC